ncbi:DUF3800 domain-containing protein [Candidatus Daviesbacteria bacterium]|nr:DUF3800 domain-containing protein [Candidatus Daviesbacteria bacterium]
MKPIKQKLYCYVDENGQDTKGNIFIVSVVVTGKERDELLSLCEVIEEKSGKGKFKWGKAEKKRRLEFIKQIFSNKKFKGKLRYSVYRNQVGYDLATITGIAKAIHFREPTEAYTTIIYIDGLFKTKRGIYGSELRKLGIPTRKVQGVTRDESNSLIRLADTIAGFVRDAIDGKIEGILRIYKEAKENGALVEI